MLKCKVKGGREEVWPLPKDVKEAIDEYLKLDAKRRATLHSDEGDTYLFQPHLNYRTLQFDKALSTRMVQHIVKRWASFGGIGDLSPHDLRRTAITRTGTPAVLSTLAASGRIQPLPTAASRS